LDVRDVARTQGSGLEIILMNTSVSVLKVSMLMRMGNCSSRVALKKLQLQGPEDIAFLRYAFGTEFCDLATTWNLKLIFHVFNM
jgi:hypothetical protein